MLFEAILIKITDFISCKINLEDDIYNFGFILLESLVGPIVTGKGEAFLLNEMVSKVLIVYEFPVKFISRFSGFQCAHFLEKLWQASFGSQDGRRRIVDPIVLTTSSQESASIVVSLTVNAYLLNHQIVLLLRIFYGTCNMLLKSRQQLILI